MKPNARPRRQFSSSEEFGRQIYQEVLLGLNVQMHGSGRVGEGSIRYQHERLVPGRDFEPYSQAELKAMNPSYPQAPAEQLTKPTHPGAHNLGAVAADNTIPNPPYRG